MALFRRTAVRPEALVAQGHELVRRSARAHAARWGLGTADRCDLDRASGVLRWTFADHVVSAPVQVLGTRSRDGSTWSWDWGWGDETVAPRLRTASETVRRWGAAHAQPDLTVPSVHGLTAQRAADLAALAFAITRANGFYRAPAGDSHLYLAFGPVTVRDPRGDPQPYTVDLDGPRRSSVSWAAETTPGRARRA